jgi:epoxyqueuosine reductase
MEAIQTFVQTLKSEATARGFAHFGITRAHRMPEAEQRYRHWLSLGHQASMGYLERNIEQRFNPALLFEGAASVITLTWPYGDAEKARSNRTGIALYAWGEDYHTHLKSKALPIIGLLKDFSPGSTSRFFTDSAFLSERSLGVMAGLGWIGKNGTLITPDRGSMLLLAEIVTSLELPADEPYLGEGCGACTRCIDACPTAAITTSRNLIASRCISYQTNTSKDTIPPDIAAKLDGRIYGCDICQQVCPWNERKGIDPAHQVDQPLFPESWPKEAASWLDKDEAWFLNHFKGSALEYKGFEKIRCNARSAVYASGEGSPHENPSN